MLGSDVSTEIKDTGSGSNGESPQTSRRTRHLGFAVGTSRLVIARENADGYQYATQRNSYLSLPHQNLTHRTLEALHIPAIAKNGRLLVYGNEAETLAELFRADAHRPLKHGLFNPDEPESEEHLLRIIASLAGTGLTEDTRVCFTIPSAPVADSELIRYQSAALLRLAARLGVKACCLDEGLAVAYAELKDSNYTGLVISFGAGVTNVCLCYLSVPVLTFSLREGGDRIEENTVRITGEPILRIRQFKEQGFRLTAGRPLPDAAAERRSRVLSVYYEEMIRSVLKAVEEQFASSSAPRLERPIPVVLAGGSVLTEGFLPRFEQIFNDTRLPIPVSRIRLAENPLTCAAKGALVAALSEM